MLGTRRVVLVLPIHSSSTTASSVVPHSTIAAIPALKWGVTVIVQVWSSTAGVHQICRMVQFTRIYIRDVNTTKVVMVVVVMCNGVRCPIIGLWLYGRWHGGITTAVPLFSLCGGDRLVARFTWCTITFIMFLVHTGWVTCTGRIAVFRFMVICITTMIICSCSIGVCIGVKGTGGLFIFILFTTITTTATIDCLDINHTVTNRLHIH